MIKIDKLVSFIEDAKDLCPFLGCYCTKLETKFPYDLYLVFTTNANNDLDCKVAFNCDDLESDYDWDWEEPTNSDGEAIGWDAQDILESGYSSEEIANKVYDAVYFIKKCLEAK